MHNPEKLERLRALRKRLRKEIRLDYGDQTEYLDRALDQITYAIHEVDEDEARFARGLDE